MRVTVEVPAEPETLEALLEGLVRVNLRLLDRSALPPLYQSGARYRRERKGSEDWKTCERVYSSRSGDCEDLAAWRVAELRHAGEVDAVAIVVPGGPRIWHVQVMRANGSVEDPSRILGMNGHG
jgi:hypothetical protein